MEPEAAAARARFAGADDAVELVATVAGDGGGAGGGGTGIGGVDFGPLMIEPIHAP